MGRKRDLTGVRFFRLVAVRDAGRTKENKVLWLCKCDCGNETVVSSTHLLSGHTKSCGCYVHEFERKGQGCGWCQTRLYRIWSGMMVRTGGWKCSDSYKAKHYKDRGISVCEEWKVSENFRDWALSNGYRDDLQLDRKDNNAGYSPENCHWVTCKENSNNKRNNLRLPDGTGLAKFCAELGIVTSENGRATKRYSWICKAWERQHKIHGELIAALKSDIERQERLLCEATTLRKRLDQVVTELKRVVEKQ